MPVATAAPEAVKQVTILGATGSIGVSTLAVIDHYPERFEVFALTAHRDWKGLLEQIKRYQPRYAVICDEQAAKQLVEQIPSSGAKTEVLVGTSALEQVASAPEVDYVMAAIVGAAGLLPTLAAAKAGKRVLLANKEALVMAGALVLEACESSGAELLPIDSEHNAIFQCLPARHRNGLEGIGVKRLVLTASGGPFRDWPAERLASVTPEQACAHPNWSMGKKISVDSATMMNKGLELIEACWLFNTRHDQVDILLHRQSIVHSLVEYEDGSMLAQLGNPDMRIPIAYGLAWPRRMESGVASLNLAEISRLDFAPLDKERFPCAGLAINAVAQGGTASVALNAANEVAVEAFLTGLISFTAIAEVIDSVMQQYQNPAADSLEQVLLQDRIARDLAAKTVASKYELKAAN